MRLIRALCLGALVATAGVPLRAEQIFVACSMLRVGNQAIYDGVSRIDFNDRFDPKTDYMTGSYIVDGTDHIDTTYGDFVDPDHTDIYGDFLVELTSYGGCDTPSIDAVTSSALGQSSGEQMCWPTTVCNLDVTINSGGYLSGGDASGHYDCDACLSLAAFPNDGWRFDGWGGDVVSESPVITVCMNGMGRSVTAFFSQEPPPPPPPPPPGDQTGGNTDYSGTGSPVILNPGGGPFHLSGLDDPVHFDITADGLPETMAWTVRGSLDAFLALDRNGNSTIDDGGELFGDATKLGNGTRAPNGFDALRDLDTNHDFQIDAHDPIWESLLLWTDVNHDGVSQASELTHIAGSPVRSINLDYHWTGRHDQNGNLFRYESTMSTEHRAVASRQPVYDIFFAVLH